MPIPMRWRSADGSPAGVHSSRAWEDIPAGHTLYFTTAEKSGRLETAANAPQLRRFRDGQPQPRMRPNATRGGFAANGAAGF